MTEILIKNGFVFDPINGINGEVLDIGIKNGKIVSPSSIDLNTAKVIDAKGKVVMPGGVDIHSHIAGPKVNAGRIQRPEDHYRVFMRAIPGVRRSGTGRTVPSTNIIGYKYARMGWTTVIEPATPPLETRHTHEELDDIPIIDKACFPLLDSNWFVLEYLQKGEYEKCAAFIAFILDAVKGYAIKLVDPGSAEAWARGRGIESIDETIPGWNITPREIIRGLHRVNELLNLPHSIHVHCNRLGYPGNYETTIETINSVADLASEEKTSIHITHCQFTGYSGESWDTLGTGADKIADVVNKRKYASIDLGQVVFGDATTMTADAPFEFVLYHLAPWKWTSSDVEAEAAAGIVPYRYRKKSYVNSIQWCIGLELALLIEDPWRVIPTTDHPNAGRFTRYPEIISWLMSKKAREEVMKECNSRAIRKAILPTIDKERDLYEIAIMTRAAPAKLLGLKNKGHLGIGADADVAIYDLNPTTDDFSREPEKVVRAFRRALWTIKGGEIVVKDGEIVKHTYGRTFYVKSTVSQDLLKEVMADVEEKFKEFYSVELENYIIKDHELRNPERIQVESKLK